MKQLPLIVLAMVSFMAQAGWWGPYQRFEGVAYVAVGHDGARYAPESTGVTLRCAPRELALWRELELEPDFTVTLVVPTGDILYEKSEVRPSNIIRRWISGEEY